MEKPESAAAGASKHPTTDLRGEPRPPFQGHLFGTTRTHQQEAAVTTSLPLALDQQPAPPPWKERQPRRVIFDPEARRGGPDLDQEHGGADGVKAGTEAERRHGPEGDGGGSTRAPPDRQGGAPPPFQGHLIGTARPRQQMATASLTPVLDQQPAPPPWKERQTRRVIFDQVAQHNSGLAQVHNNAMAGERTNKEAEHRRQPPEGDGGVSGGPTAQERAPPPFQGHLLNKNPQRARDTTGERSAPRATQCTGRRIIFPALHRASQDDGARPPGKWQQQSPEDTIEDAELLPPPQ